MARIITREEHAKLLERNCDKGKHHLRVNRYGVTWCTYCGLLSTKVNAADPAEENDQLIIKCL